MHNYSYEDKCPLSIAAESSNFEVVQYLIDSCNVTEASVSNNCMLYKLVHSYNN